MSSGEILFYLICTGMDYPISCSLGTLKLEGSLESKRFNFNQITVLNLPVESI
jgi:hypothetical protein